MWKCYFQEFFSFQIYAVQTRHSQRHFRISQFTLQDSSTFMHDTSALKYPLKITKLSSTKHLEHHKDQRNPAWKDQVLKTGFFSSGDRGHFRMFGCISQILIEILTKASGAFDSLERGQWGGRSLERGWWQHPVSDTRVQFIRLTSHFERPI